MKKVFLHILIIAASVYYCHAQKTYLNELKTVSYCRLFDSAAYDGQRVRTTLVLHYPEERAPRVDGGPQSFFYSKQCNGRDFFAAPDFLQAENLSLLTENSSTDNKLPKLYTVTLTGKFSLSFVSSFGELGWLRAGFSVEKIESVKLTKSGYALPDHKKDAPILETGASLHFANSEFMFALLGKRGSIRYLTYPSLKDSKISVNGQLLDNPQILQFSREERTGTIGVGIRKSVADKNRWRISGVITNIMDGKPAKEMYFENEYLLEKDHSWRLIYSNINESNLFKAD